MLLEWQLAVRCIMLHLLLLGSVGHRTTAPVAEDHPHNKHHSRPEDEAVINGSLVAARYRTELDRVINSRGTGPGWTDDRVRVGVVTLSSQHDNMGCARTSPGSHCAHCIRITCMHVSIPPHRLTPSRVVHVVPRGMPPPPPSSRMRLEHTPPSLPTREQERNVHIHQLNVYAQARV